MRKHIHFWLPVLWAAVAAAGSNEIIVTATRTYEAESEVPASVSVIYAERLKGMAAVNADEMLRSLSGISVLRNYGAGSGIPGQVNIRGIPGLHGLLMLSDGYRLNEAATGFLSPNEVPVAAIDRIETVRGPFSALYGADAFSGVVNMILREPGTGKKASFSAGAGNDGFSDTVASISGSAGSSAYFAAVQSVGMDNVLAQDKISESVWNPQAGAYMTSDRAAENFNYRDNRVIVKTVTGNRDSGRVALQLRFFDSSLGMGMEDMRPYYPKQVESDAETRSIFAGTEYTRQAGADLELSARASIRDQRREVRGLDMAGYHGAVPVFAESLSRTDANEAEMALQVNYRQDEPHSLTAGADFRHSKADFGGLKEALTGVQFASSMPDSADVNNFGLYLQDRLEAGSVTLIAGARIDSHTDFGEAFSPKAGILWHASEDVSLRAAAGRAFRAPSLLELHQPSVGYGSITFVSNPDLEPEYVNSVDAGITFNQAGRYRLGIDAFYNDMEDLIAPSIDGRVYTYRNVSEAWSRGLELEITAEPAGWIVLYASATLQDAEDETAGTGLQHIPDEILAAGFRCSTGSGGMTIRLSLDAVYTGKREYVDELSGQWRQLDSFVRTDAAAGLEFAGHYNLGIKASNAFDEEYQESPVVNPAPGRVLAFYAGFEW